MESIYTKDDMHCMEQIMDVVETGKMTQFIMKFDYTDENDVKTRRQVRVVVMPEKVEK